MTPSQISLIVAPLVMAAALVVGACEAPADGLVTMPVKDPLTLKECSACHIAYPPGLLPARSWRAITANLKDHFGENAELAPEEAKAIGDYLAANAADASGGRSKVMRDLKIDVTPLRISETPWWARKHERKNRTSPQAMARAGAKFKGDCKACHAGAAKGIFDDD